MSDVETTVMRHLKHLCVKIGARPVGSKENQQAASYIQQVFEMSSAKLRQVVALITDMIESLQDKTPNWCREPR